MNEFLLQHQSFLQALGLAMLQSLGQGFIIFLLLKIALPLIPGRRANLRYLISYAALSTLFVGFIYTFFTEWQTAAGLAVNANFNPALQPLAAANGADAVQAGNVWYFTLAPYFSTIRKYLPLMALGYTAGICILCCRMIWQIFKVQLLRKQVIEPDVQLNSLFTALREKVGWSSKVLIKLSDKINVPVVFGHLKPLVLLPVALVTKLDVQQVEAILLHEIGHVKRNDYLFNIRQSVILSFLFFNPFTRWIAANIRTEREHCCDDYVLKHTRQSLPYAYVLLALEEYRSASLSPAMAADGNSKSPLFNRIKRITTMTTPQKKNQRNLGAVTVLVLVAAMICFATAFSQDKKSAPAKSKKSDKSYTEQATKEKEDTYVEERQEKESTKEPREEEYGAGTMNADEAMKIAKKAMETASKSMKEIDWNKIASDVEKAGKDIDWTAVNQSLEQAKESIDAIDWKEIQQSMKEAQSSVDWPEIRKAMNEASREVDKAMKEVDEELKNMDDKHSSNYNSGEAEARADQLRAAALIKQDVARLRQDEAIRRQDELIRRQEQIANEGQRKALARQEEAIRRQEKIMNEGRERALAGQREAIRKHNEAIRKHNEAVRKAQENIEAAQDKASVRSSRSQSTSDAIVDKLANKGLVKKDGNFKVKLTKAKLIVNGQEQPEAIAREFRNYLESEGQTLTITVKNN